MNERTIDYLDAPREWPEVVNNVLSGESVLLQEANKTVAVIISFDDYLAVREQLEDLHDVRLAEAALEEYRRDPSTAIPWEEAKAKLRAEGLIDGE